MAQVVLTQSPSQIAREASSRFIDINISVDQRPVASVEADVRSLLSQHALPYEYHAAVLDDASTAHLGKLPRRFVCVF